MANIKFTTVTDATRAGGTPADGEYVWTSDTKKFYRGDGSTSGGVLIGAQSSATIDDNSVTLAKLVQTTQYKILGRSSSGTGNWQEITATANVFSILQAADYAAIRTLLGLVIGTNVQAYDANTVTTTATQTLTNKTLTAPVLGTPASGTLTNCTGLPVSGISASTATAIGVGSIELGHASDTTIARVSAGVVSIEGVNVVTVSATQTLTNKTLTSPVLTTPSLGTPTSGTLTSCTGLPVSTGISGFGANVATALGINVGTAGSPVVNGGALGTPSSGTLTNCTGLPTAGIVDANVTNAKLANMAASTFKGRVTASTGVPEDLTAAQARAIVESAAPDTVTITGSTTLTKASHQGKVLYCTTGALNLTVDNSTDFDAYASCEIWNKTGAVVTFVATATINRIGSKPLTLPANGRAVLSREATADVYLLTGEMS